MISHEISDKGHFVPRETQHGVRSERLMQLFLKFGVSGVARKLGLARYSVVRWCDIPKRHLAAISTWEAPGWVAPSASLPNQELPL